LFVVGREPTYILSHDLFVYEILVRILFFNFYDGR